MQAEFWHDVWNQNEQGLHEEEANPLLTQHFKQLNLKEGSRIFLPLCGKTTSIPWLMSFGHSVVGVELSKKAVDQLFEDLEITPCITEHENLLHYQAENIDVYVGDFFALTNIGQIDAIYDRGSLVALPLEMRQRYTKQLMKLTNNAPQLVVAYEYDQKIMQGPPFAINPDELNDHYAAHYQLQKLGSLDADDLMERVEETEKKNNCIVENIWLLSSKKPTYWNKN